MVWFLLGGSLPALVAGASDLPPASKKIPIPLASQGLFKFWNFDTQPAGESPNGFSSHTVGSNQVGSWKIEPAQEALSSPNQLSQNTACSTEACFHLLLVEGLTYEYFDVAVRLRLAERSQGGGGMVFAVQDQQNFYAAVADFQANIIEVIRMLDGNATLLARAPVQPWKSPWHLLRIRRNTIISKEYIEAFFDNVQILSLEDKTFREGQIGLVTKGDAVIAFDNLNAAPLYSQKPLSPPAAY